MSFDAQALNAAIENHGAVMRVVIGAVKGSSPRDVGASMLVWDGGQSGTIGGGALEYQAAGRFRSGVTRHPLGPELGQCCGGHVTLISEVFEHPIQVDQIFLRQVEGSNPCPLSLERSARAARNGSGDTEFTFKDGWVLEPVSQMKRPLWIWGAGHVGRAVVDVMHDLAQFDITWVDTSLDRFPDAIPQGVSVVPAADPALLMPHAPNDADHLVFTYSHPLDLALCHAGLTHGFASFGLIGSNSKWARFQNRLRDLGHTPTQIARITCPIGDPSFGKQPKEIAIGVAAQLMRVSQDQVSVRGNIA